MKHRAQQLILPLEPALPGRRLILAPRLWADDDTEGSTTIGEAGGNNWRSGWRSYSGPWCAPLTPAS